MRVRNSSTAFSTPDHIQPGTGAAEEKPARDCCLARIIPRPLNASPFRRGGVARAVRIKAAQTKPWGRESRRETGCGDPNFYAREQILESDAPARAARVKMRVRIQLKLCHRTRTRLINAKASVPFFSRTRPQCLSSLAAFARASWIVRACVRSTRASVSWFASFECNI